MQPENVPNSTRKRNIALLAVLGLVIVLLYALTVTKFTDSAKSVTPSSTSETTGTQTAPAAAQ